METTIRKKIKGAIMETIFESDENCNVRYFTNNDDVNDFDPEKKYMYTIVIRHSENENPKELLNVPTLGEEADLIAQIFNYALMPI